MKSLSLMTTYLLLFLTTASLSQRPKAIDLHQLIKNNGIEVYNREMTLVNEGQYAGIRLSKDFGEGVAWLKGVEFSNGIIEFDVRGENVKQHSFVGIAFHGKDTATYDAIYLRPISIPGTR